MGADKTIVKVKTILMEVLRMHLFVDLNIITFFFHFSLTLQFTQ